MKLMPIRVCSALPFPRACGCARKGYQSADSARRSADLLVGDQGARHRHALLRPPRAGAGRRPAKDSICTASACRRAGRGGFLVAPRMRRLKATLSVQSRCGKQRVLWNIIAVPRFRGRWVMFSLYRNDVAVGLPPRGRDSCAGLVRAASALTQQAAIGAGRYTQADIVHGDGASPKRCHGHQFDIGLRRHGPP